MMGRHARHAALGGRGAPDGEHRAERGGEEIVERWEGGRLQERTFRRLDGAPPGLIRVTYEGGLGGEEPPQRVILDNGWLGYRLELQTLTFQRIPEPEPAPAAEPAAEPGGVGPT